MVLFTLLGVIALIQRERRKVNNSDSGQDEQVEQSDVPPVRSYDGREYDDDGQGVDLSLEEPISSHSEVSDDWSDSVFKDVVGDLSEWRADVLQALNGVVSKFNDNSLQTPVHVATDLSVDVLQAAVPATVDCRVNDPQTTVCAVPDCSDDVPKATVCDKLDSDNDAPPALFCAELDSEDDAPPVLFYAEPDSEDVAPPAVFCAEPNCNADVPEAAVRQTEDRVLPQSSQLQDKKTKIIDINSCSYEIGIHLGRGGFGTVYSATRLKDGLQVAVKFASSRKTKSISIDGYTKTVPLEVALLIRANQGSMVPEIIQLLDWQERPGYYIMVLERPMPCQSLYEFIKNYKGSIEEDLARFIMRQAIFAAQTCCRRGVFHRDIKADNFLINPKTLKVKLIDFGCGDFLTDAGYTSFAGTKQFCPSECLMTSRYHGESATVWSLGVLLFVILFQKTPNRRDLCKMEDYIWTKDGLSQECCNFICCCLQINRKQQLKLEKLSLHNWFTMADTENNDKRTIIDINSCSYEIGIQLSVRVGTIYAATRLKDGLQVAVKFISKRNKKLISIDGYPKSVPLEVALLIRANEGPRVPEIIQLLDWQEEPDRYIMVLEWPMPCEELDWFVLNQTVITEENLAWVIMRQATTAAQTCCRRGVLYCDINAENFLINPDTLEVKLIDFRCGEILTDAAYTSFAGAEKYCPPEYLITSEYHGEPAMVWSLGIFLFTVLCGDFPARRDLDQINKYIWTRDGLSKECCNFICCCLQSDPKQRIELEKLSLHNWFKKKKLV